MYFFIHVLLIVCCISRYNDCQLIALTVKSYSAGSVIASYSSLGQVKRKLIIFIVILHVIVNKTKMKDGIILMYTQQSK